MKQRRRSIFAKGASHVNPIPSASRIGNIVFTGSIFGIDPKTKEVPNDPAAQVRLLFANLRDLVAECGATTDDIIKLAFSVKSLSVREAINEEWIAMFPDPDSRPARHVFVYEHLAGNQVVSCEACLVISEG
jgi:2-iminobutanoate/2-iminopropanoate deaminase